MYAIPYYFQYRVLSDKALYYDIHVYEIRYTCTSVQSQKTLTFPTKKGN